MSSKPVYFKLIFHKQLQPEVEIQARHDGTYVHMTPKISKSEFDGYINLLIEELEYIRREGKRKFTETK